MDTTVATTSSSSHGSTTSCSAAIRSYSVVVMVAGAVSSPPDVATVATLPSLRGPMTVRIVLPRFVLCPAYVGLSSVSCCGDVPPPSPRESKHRATACGGLQARGKPFIYREIEERGAVTHSAVPRTCCHSVDSVPPCRQRARDTVT